MRRDASSRGESAERMGLLAHYGRSAVALMVTASLFSALAQILFKMSGASAHTAAAVGWAIAGVMAYGPALPLSLRAYDLASLSRMFPLSSLLYVWATIAGVLMFGERPTLKVIMGTLCIVAGVIILAREQEAIIGDDEEDA